MKAKQNSNTAARGLMYVTSDQHVFLSRDEALKHAGTLDEQTIRHLSRDEAEAQIWPSDTPQNELDDLLDALTGN